MFDVKVQKTVDHGKAGFGIVTVIIVCCVGALVPLLAVADGAIVIVTLQYVEGIDVKVGRGVNLIIDIKHQVAEVTFALCRGMVYIVAGGVAAIGEGGSTIAAALSVTMAAGKVDVKLHSVAITYIAHPG